MLFTSPIFLYIFLPLVVIGHAVIPGRWRNPFLLVASLLFYCFGEIAFGLVFVANILVTHALCSRITRTADLGRRRRLLGGVIVINIGLLAVFKYANFVVANVNLLLERLGVAALPDSHVSLPLAISFFTFQAIAFAFDIYRQPVGEELPTRRDFALFLLCFPQLIAGPIVRYHDVKDHLRRRQVTVGHLQTGLYRFVLGLFKKLIIADNLGAMADSLFGLPNSALGPSHCWLAAIAYFLQIFYDFSGYTDMAIGIGRMLGFTYPENFRAPYSALSITDFWRRWHITLSTWFRDYLYIPLGGNRLGRGRTLLNLLIVFFLCGLWHGASWMFVVWGLYHGAWLILERVGRGKIDRLPKILRWSYTALAVLVGWVFFRATSISQAWEFLSLMAGITPAGERAQSVLELVSNTSLTVLPLAVVGCLPVTQSLLADVRKRGRGARLTLRVIGVVRPVAIVAMLWLSLIYATSATFDPFIYFRF